MDKSSKKTEQIQYWKKSAERSWESAKGLYKLGHRDACLFFCHLTLEKILKGIILQRTNQTPPYLHDLAKLAYLAGLTLDQDTVRELKVITTFNVAARYDEIKFDFYKKCTPSFTKKYFEITKIFLSWLKKEFLKK